MEPLVLVRGSEILTSSRGPAGARSTLDGGPRITVGAGGSRVRRGDHQRQSETKPGVVNMGNKTLPNPKGNQGRRIPPTRKECNQKTNGPT